MLFEYSTSIEERKEEKAMLKILKENEKRMDGHFAVEIFEVEDFGLIAVDNDTSNGETMEAWKCDNTGAALDKNTSNFRVREV